MKVCDCIGRCKCGAIDDNGVLRDGYAVRINPMIMDGRPSAASSGRPIKMMTDVETLAMRDRVRNMTVTEAAKLPLYDNVRGCVFGGQPADRYFALIDGARPDQVTDAQVDRLARQELYERRISGAWRCDDKTAPTAIRTEGNGQAAYEARIADAWRQEGGCQ